MRIFVAIGLVLFLSACAGGGNSGSAGSLGVLNPLNWFGGARAQSEQPAQNEPSAGRTVARLSLAPRRGYPVVVDTRGLVDQITGLVLERTASGAIVRATALTPSMGYYDADLILVPSVARNEITLQFRVRAPVQTGQPGPARLRELVAGYVLSAAQLRGIRQIAVNGARNSRSLRP